MSVTDVDGDLTSVALSVANGTLTVSLAGGATIVLAAAAGVAGRSYLDSSASASVPGILVVNTDPPGVPVVLDGKRSGTTPVKLEVAAGEHVLTLLAEGLRQTEIAARLAISPKTVASHIEHVLTKLGVHSRAEAVALVYRDGLLRTSGWT